MQRSELGAVSKASMATVSVALLAACVLMTLAGCDMMDRSHSLTLMNKGVKYFNGGNYPKAVEELKESVRVWPDNDRAFFMLGQIYQFKYNQFDEAHKYYDEAAQLVPDRADYWYFKGACLVETRQDSDAEVALTKAIQLKEDHAEAHNRLGMLQERQGALVKAAESYGSSVRANARLPFAYHNLGDLYYRNDKLEEARQVFENGVGNNPEHPELHHGLGVVYLSKADYPGAVKEFQAALDLKPSYPSAIYNLGMAHQDQGDNLKAKTYLEKFISMAGGGDNAARVAAAEARLLQIQEAERKR